MFHLSRSAVWILSVLICCGYARQAVGDDEFVFYHENVMGTSLELRVRADSPEAAGWAEKRVLGEIDRLSAIFSGYDQPERVQPLAEFQGCGHSGFPGAF